jgi:hypothetical protein
METNSVGWPRVITQVEAESLLAQVQHSLQNTEMSRCRPGRYSATDRETIAMAEAARAEDIIEFGRPPYIFEPNSVEIILRSQDANVKLSILVTLSKRTCQQYELSKIVT